MRRVPKPHDEPIAAAISEAEPQDATWSLPRDLVAEGTDVGLGPSKTAIGSAPSARSVEGLRSAVLGWLAEYETRCVDGGGVSLADVRALRDKVSGWK